MAFNGVLGSDKAHFRFTYMQASILVTIWLLAFVTEVTGEVVAPLDQVSVIVYVIWILSLRISISIMAYPQDCLQP